jgi:hypothetical protein
LTKGNTSGAVFGDSAYRSDETETTLEAQSFKSRIHGRAARGPSALEGQSGGESEEAGLDPGPTLVAIERRDFVIDPIPIDLAGELRRLVFEIDDLIEPRSEQFGRTCRLWFLWSHRIRSDAQQNHGSSRKKIAN